MLRIWDKPKKRLIFFLIQLLSIVTNDAETWMISVIFLQINIAFLADVLKGQYHELDEAHIIEFV